MSTDHEQGDAIDLITRVKSLETQVKNLTKVAIGQAASTALLTTLLAKAKVITPMEARLVVMAGVEAQDYEDLAAGDITKWAVTQMEEYLKKP